MPFRAVSRLLIFLCMLAAVGCAPHRPPPLPLDAGLPLKVGETTYDQVLAAYGRPMMTTVMSSGDKMVTYARAASNVRSATFIPVVGLFAGGVDMSSNSISMTFGPDGLLKSYTTHEMEMCSGTGALSTVSAENCQR